MEVGSLNRKNPLNIIDNKDLLMVSLVKFFSSKSHITQIIPIVNGKNALSLRLIDWFVTNYSKKFGTIITREVDRNIMHFNVYLSYRSQLKAYSKQQFDPFRRRDRINFFYEKAKYIETTIGQLNFFRWVLENNILEYIDKHYDNIEADMVAAQKENLRKRANHENIRIKVIQTETGTVTQQRKKRHELSKSFIKNMNQFAGTRKINFD